MAVLYRKYRPQTFAEVIGQGAVVQTLKNQVTLGQVSHAYLFTGSRGVGKTSIARILAKAVNCTGVESEKLKVESGKHPHPDPLPKGEGGLRGDAGDACGECSVCKQIEAGNFLDLVEIDAASNTGVDNIRELIEHVKFAPSIGKYKVFIIDEVHMLSKGAFNALLKTLEEPPTHTIFILATTEINKVPATIISRTQRFDFKALSSDDLEKHLVDIVKQEKVKLPKEILSLIAQNAQGSVRDSLSLLDKVLTLGGKATLEEAQQLLGVTDLAWCEELLLDIADQNISAIPPFFDRLQEKSLDMAIFNRDFLNYLRVVLVGKVVGANAPSGAPKIAELISKLEINEIILIIRLFLKSYKDLASSPSPEIPVLIAAMEAGSRKKGKAISSAQPTPATDSRISSAEVLSSVSNSSVSQIKSTPIKQPSVNVFENPHHPPRSRQAERVEAGQPLSQRERGELEADPLPSVVAKVMAEKKEEEEKHEKESDRKPHVVDISFEAIQLGWPQVITIIKDINGPLASMLKNSTLMRLDSDRLVLGVKFSFDKQSLGLAKNIKIISEAMEQVYNQQLNIWAEVIKAAEAQPAAAALGEALKIFGGELIE